MFLQLQVEITSEIDWTFFQQQIDIYMLTSSGIHFRKEYVHFADFLKKLKNTMVVLIFFDRIWVTQVYYRKFISTYIIIIAFVLFAIVL